MPTVQVSLNDYNFKLLTEVGDLTGQKPAEILEDLLVGPVRTMALFYEMAVAINNEHVGNSHEHGDDDD